MGLETQMPLECVSLFGAFPCFLFYFILLIVITFRLLLIREPRRRSCFTTTTRDGEPYDKGLEMSSVSWAVSKSSFFFASIYFTNCNTHDVTPPLSLANVMRRGF
jgi:hypothetical protein